MPKIEYMQMWNAAHYEEKQRWRQDHPAYAHGLEWVCHICKQLPKKFKLHVDHNHTTKQVRKLLCNSCNVMIGALESKKYPLFLDYLKEHAQ